MFLYVLSLFKIQKRATLSTRNARFCSNDVRRSRRLKREAFVFLSLKSRSSKEKLSDFSLTRYTFLSQRDDDDDDEEARLYVFFKNARKRRTRRRRFRRLRRCEEEKEEEKKKRKRRRVGVERYRLSRWNEEE